MAQQALSIEHIPSANKDLSEQGRKAVIGKIAAVVVKKGATAANLRDAVFGKNNIPGIVIKGEHWASSNLAIKWKSRFRINGDIYCFIRFDL